MRRNKDEISRFIYRGLSDSAAFERIRKMNLPEITQKAMETVKRIKESTNSELKYFSVNYNGWKEYYYRQ